MRSFAQDISRIVEMLDTAGVVEWSGRQEALTTWRQRFWTGGTVSMTAFGRHVLPEFLPAAGLVLRTAADLTEADLPDLIAAMDTAPEQHHSAMLAAWKPTLAAADRAAIVAALITDAPDARMRLIGLRLLGMFDADVAEPHMRQLLDTAAAGHAAIWLLDHGLADGDTGLLRHHGRRLSKERGSGGDRQAGTRNRALFPACAPGRRHRMARARAGMGPAARCDAAGVAANRVRRRPSPTGACAE